MDFELTITPDDAITKLAYATGNKSFRVSATLRGWVRGNQFRITFPPGFAYPCQPIVSGEVSASESGCRIEYSFASPLLSYVSLCTMGVLAASLTWPNLEMMALGLAALIAFGALCLTLRKRDKKVLLEKLRNVFSE